VPSELVGVDWDVFWHCADDVALTGFAVFEKDQVAALATVWDDGEPVWEIGMDVAPDARGRGLGQEVMAAAVDWVLENGRVPLATVGPFNVPSARTLRSVGLRYVMSDMKGMKGPFQVPPQPVGRPYEGVALHDYYPAWAMNKDIVRR
jgi:RimJ/RimL family protein N-acetyltransferase